MPLIFSPTPIESTAVPGHGLIVVEKWVHGKAPFQAIWEAMDAGDLEIGMVLLQGPLTFTPTEDGRMKLLAEV